MELLLLKIIQKKIYHNHQKNQKKTKYLKGITVVFHVVKLKQKNMGKKILVYIMWEKILLLRK